jgi:hypothetical protein
VWFRVDDGFYSHPKVFATSPAALGLWVVAGSWSSQARTGGVIPRHALARLLPGAEALADELVVAGLWENDRSGAYRFHDWTGYNPSAEEAQAAKAKQGTAGKLGNHRRWHLGRGQVDPSCAWCTDREADPSPDRVPDRSTDRGGDPGGDSTRSRPDAGRAPRGAGAPIGSDRVPTAETVGSALGGAGDVHVSETTPDRVPDGDPESGGNPPSRPVPTRPVPVSPTSVGGVGEDSADAAASRPTDEPKRKASPKGTRLPEGFAVSDEMREWAREHAPTCGMRDHEAFVDYWLSAPGAKGRKLDWVRTWRNWMRREHDRRAGRPGAGSGSSAPARSVTSERVEGWLGLGSQDAPDGSQTALEAPTAQEVSPWLNA